MGSEGAALGQSSYGPAFVGEGFGTPLQVYPGLRGDLCREPTHREKGISRGDLNAEATDAINDDCVICHLPTWVGQALLHLRIFTPRQWCSAAAPSTGHAAWPSRAR